MSILVSSVVVVLGVVALRFHHNLTSGVGRVRSILINFWGAMVGRMINETMTMVDVASNPEIPKRVTKDMDILVGNVLVNKAARDTTLPMDTLDFTMADSAS